MIDGRLFAFLCCFIDRIVVCDPKICVPSFTVHSRKSYLTFVGFDDFELCAKSSGKKDEMEKRMKKEKDEMEKRM